MRARGAKGIGTNIGILPDVGIFYSDNIDALLKQHVKQEDIIPAVGGAKNTSGIGRRTGGGGDGEKRGNYNYYGTAGTSFSGGSGGGGGDSRFI